MELAGTVTVGPYLGPEVQDFVVSTTSRPTLIYEKPISASPISIISCNPSSDYLQDRWDYPITSDGPPFPKACFSATPLEDVDCVQVFCNPTTHSCKGCIFYYTNLSQRALGQCRVGIGCVTTYSRPTHFCVNSLDSRSHEPGIFMSYATEKNPHKHDSSDWKCFKMEGILEFWFARGRIQLRVTRNE